MSLSRSPGLITVANAVARELRQRQTEEEQMLWEAVRDRRFMGKKFLRQHPILVDSNGRETFFVADFYCASSKLIVEIDGKIHNHQQERDRMRTAAINNRGLRVVRFRNEEVRRSLSSVLKRLSKEL